MTHETITPFLFDGDITVRVIDENFRLAWVTTDVCRALGVMNASDAVKGLDDDEKGIASIYTLGGYQQLSVVYESGLYALILKSRKEPATRFRKWITSEVLPSIRRTGMYAMPGGIVPLQKHPWGEWSLAELRANISQVNTARMTFSRGAGAWMWDRLGFPMPPRHLLPAWWQPELMHDTTI